MSSLDILVPMDDIRQAFWRKLCRRMAQVVVQSLLTCVPVPDTQLLIMVSIVKHFVFITLVAVTVNYFMCCVAASAYPFGTIQPQLHQTKHRSWPKIFRDSFPSMRGTWIGML